MGHLPWTSEPSFCAPDHTPYLADLEGPLAADDHEVRIGIVLPLHAHLVLVRVRGPEEDVSVESDHTESGDGECAFDN